ncbi:hypothetical protein L7F22_033098 [Adiantum nelumboides]|nr:hypothetical protein [Adiantum nelumboides]
MLELSPGQEQGKVSDKAEIFRSAGEKLKTIRDFMEAGYTEPEAKMVHIAQVDGTPEIKMGLLEVGIFEDLKEEHRKDSGLTREDIESLTVDENLTDLQRAQLFLSTSAHQLQQSCAFERLPSIFSDYGVAAYDALFPALTSSIENFNPHIQLLPY